MRRAKVVANDQDNYRGPPHVKFAKKYYFLTKIIHEKGQSSCKWPRQLPWPSSCEICKKYYFLTKNYR